MRSLILAGLLGLLIGLCPSPSSADRDSEIFLDFPELAEWGRIISIGGHEYWQPHPAYLPVDWEPYTNGYLTDDPTDGLTWVSQDPWGFITEHYGYWRHHENYGFVWRPLYPIEWRPYVASLFRDGGGSIVGWTPFYYDAWDRGYYVVGFGFNDYYWGSFWNRVHYADFYAHHWWRFHGYHVCVTIYDHHRHYRPFPGPCHRRDREYRQRRQRHPHGNGKHSDLAVRSGLPARRAEATPARRRTTPDAPGPKRGVNVPEREMSVAQRESARPARAVAAPARDSNVARERKERMQQLRDRMQSHRSPAVATQRSAQRRSSAGVSAPQRPSQRRGSVGVSTRQQRSQRQGSAGVSAPQRTSRATPSMPRRNLEVRRPSTRNAAPAVSRPSAPASRPAATRVAPRRSAPSRPAVKAQRSSSAERAKKALPVKRKAKSKRGS